MTAFATVDELQARLDFTMTEGERGVASGALEDLSLDARTYGRETWMPGTAPTAIKSLVLRAAARYMRNIDGYESSRAGDETVSWRETGRQGDTAEFHESEIARIRALRGVTGFGTLPIVAWGTSPVGEELRVRDGDSTIPFVHADEADWYERVASRQAL